MGTDTDALREFLSVNADHHFRIGDTVEASPEDWNRDVPDPNE